MTAGYAYVDIYHKVRERVPAREWRGRFERRFAEQAVAGVLLQGRLNTESGAYIGGPIRLKGEIGEQINVIPDPHLPSTKSGKCAKGAVIAFSAKGGNFDDNSERYILIDRFA